MVVSDVNMTALPVLAFGSLIFATYRGLGSMGSALFIGVGTCFLTSIFILPALLKLVEKKSQTSHETNGLEPLVHSQ